MEIESNAPQVAAKRLWKIVRIVFYMLRKGVMSKTKLQFALQHMVNKSKIAGQAISNFAFVQNHNYSCKSNHHDVAMSLITRREYEFSCSNSPDIPSYFTRKKNNHIRRYKSEEIAVVQKVFDMLNTTSTSADNSPLALPGFGKSPMVRVTDSPFPLKDSEESNNSISQVDKDAEEFIKKFYKDLKQQKRIAASPSPCHDV